MIDQPHQAAINILRQIKSADLVIQRRLKVEDFEVCFCKESKETTLGLVVGGKPLPSDQVTLQITSQLRDAYQQEQQILGVAILQIHSSSLAAEEGSLCVGDFIDEVCYSIAVIMLLLSWKQINDVKVSGNADDAAEMLKEAIGIITLRICR